MIYTIYFHEFLRKIKSCNVNSTWSWSEKIFQQNFEIRIGYKQNEYNKYDLRTLKDMK